MKKITAIIIAISCLLSVFSFGISANATDEESIARNEKTTIGAIYYHNWFQTYPKWWNYNNHFVHDKDSNSSQEARCLSPKEYHYRLPFFASINTEITESKYINGDLSAGVAEFPEFTLDIWSQEMAYAVDAGINFMAYLWSEPNRNKAVAYRYHIQTKGYGGKIKMSAILQNEKQDFATMADAMCEEFWQTLDGMPIVYIYNAPEIATKDFVNRIQNELAQAQRKKGKEEKRAYIVGLGVYNKNMAQKCIENGVDAISWYAFSGSGAATEAMERKWELTGARIKEMKFAYLTKYQKECIEYAASVCAPLDVMPTITLGYNTKPRIDNPVRWMWVGADEVAYKGYTIEDPTPTELTKNVLDILNWTKLNYKKTKSNTVLIYSWNEYDEGGWMSPTLAVDENGAVIKNADGTNKINRENLDAVKKGIELYRKNEAEAAIYNVDGEITEYIYYDNADDNNNTKPSVTTEPTQEPVQNENSGNSWLLWACVGGAIVAAAAAVVVVVLKKKKAASENAEEKAE